MSDELAKWAETRLTHQPGVICIELYLHGLWNILRIWVELRNHFHIRWRSPLSPPFMNRGIEACAPAWKIWFGSTNLALGRSPLSRFRPPSMVLMELLWDCIIIAPWYDSKSNQPPISPHLWEFGSKAGVPPSSYFAVFPRAPFSFTLHRLIFV